MKIFAIPWKNGRESRLSTENDTGVGIFRHDFKYLNHMNNWTKNWVNKWSSRKSFFLFFFSNLVSSSILNNWKRAIWITSFRIEKCYRCGCQLSIQSFAHLFAVRIKFDAQTGFIAYFNLFIVFSFVNETQTRSRWPSDSILFLFARKYHMHENKCETSFAIEYSAVLFDTLGGERKQSGLCLSYVFSGSKFIIGMRARCSFFVVLGMNFNSSGIWSKPNEI